MRDVRLVACITFHNVVLPHFLWFKLNIGPGDMALLRPYAMSEIGSTQSEGEPIMCGIDTQTPLCHTLACRIQLSAADSTCAFARRRLLRRGPATSTTISDCAIDSGAQPPSLDDIECGVEEDQCVDCDMEQPGQRHATTGLVGQPGKAHRHRHDVERIPKAVAIQF
jgi:hypothetical protein